MLKSGANSSDFKTIVRLADTHSLDQLQSLTRVPKKVIRNLLLQHKAGKKVFGAMSVREAVSAADELSAAEDLEENLETDDDELDGGSGLASPDGDIPAELLGEQPETVELTED